MSLSSQVAALATRVAAEFNAVRTEMVASQAAETTGVIKSYGGFTAPTGYLMCDGAAVSRTTYATLFDATTIAATGSTTNLSSTVTTVTNMTFMEVGMPISGPGIQAGTTITAINTGAATITLSLAATATASGVALRACPWGVGDGSTTFNVPDGRDRSPVGKNTLRLGGNDGLAAGSARDSRWDSSHGHGSSASDTLAVSSASAGTPSGSVSGSVSVPSGAIGALSAGSPSATFNATAGGSGVAGQGHSHTISGGSHGHSATFSGSFTGSAMGTHGHTLTGGVSVSVSNNSIPRDPYFAANYIIKT